MLLLLLHTTAPGLLSLVIALWVAKMRRSLAPPPRVRELTLQAGVRPRAPGMGDQPQILWAMRRMEVVNVDADKQERPQTVELGET